jgi:hypothetical protein
MYYEENIPFFGPQRRSLSCAITIEKLQIRNDNLLEADKELSITTQFLKKFNI